MLTKNQQEHPGKRLSAQGLQQLGEQGRQISDYIPLRVEGVVSERIARIELRGFRLVLIERY